jgi:hypothetical protein
VRGRFALPLGFRHRQGRKGERGESSRQRANEKKQGAKDRKKEGRDRESRGASRKRGETEGAIDCASEGERETETSIKWVI